MATALASPAWALRCSPGASSCQRPQASAPLPFFASSKRAGRRRSLTARRVPLLVPFASRRRPQACAVCKPALEATSASHALQDRSECLAALVAQLKAARTIESKVILLSQLSEVQSFQHRNSFSKSIFQACGGLLAEEAYVILALLAMGQGHILHAPPAGESLERALSRLAQDLLRVDRFYDSLGGLVGYQLKCLQIMRQAELQELGKAGTACQDTSCHIPRGPDLAGDRGMVALAAAHGLEALPTMAEIYPVGGAGDRLGLKCDVTGDSIPTAMLPYCGRTLLEGLIRDLQAREYLHFRLSDQQHTTPVVMMTSDAKGNHQRLQQLLECMNWFGRGKESFRLARQPMVPVVSAEDGAWLLPQPFEPMMKPGGHGAIWKLMLDEGIFEWLARQRRSAALVRQISNPLAGTDATLLGLTGTGYIGAKSFGFACCERAVGATEGMNVLVERQVSAPTDTGNGTGVAHEYHVTNVEYTEFQRLGVSEQGGAGSKFSRFPANTNVLYVGLKTAEGAVKAGVASGGGAALPGLIFNRNKTVEYDDALSGQRRAVAAGRLECTMQNLVDSLTQQFPAPLSPERHADLETFVVYNKRRRVTSSAKKRRTPGSMVLAQTPDGSFLDLMRNAEELLLRCAFTHVPPVGTVEEYLERGPGFMFLFNPALGPLWDVIAQKLRGGALAPGAELVLEVAEAALTNLQLHGSLLVLAGAVLGHVEEERLVYGDECGRVRLTNVTVHNAGVDWGCQDNVYWQHRVARLEAVRITLHGRSEFEAADLLLAGSHTFEVPDGHRMVAMADASGRIVTELHPLAAQPTWRWEYSMAQDGTIGLRMTEAVRPGSPWWSPSPGNGGVGYGLPLPLPPRQQAWWPVPAGQAGQAVEEIERSWLSSQL